MKKSAPCIRALAAFMAAVLLRTTAAGAVSLTPGSLAVIEPPMPVPEMRAAWNQIRSEIYLDPLLLVRGREEVQQELYEWEQAARAIRSAYTTAERATLDRARAILEDAWASYYRFDYGSASSALTEAGELLLTPGDSGFRSRLMFEVHLLGGIVARAAGEKDYTEKFKRAAAIDPQRNLPPEKYSPQIVNLYNSLRKELVDKDRVSLFVEGAPADAAVYLGDSTPDGAVQQSGILILPGTYFLEASAPGYEPWGRVIEVERFEPVRIRYDLIPTGPEGDPDSFFLARLKAGDRPYLALLAGKLGVDYLLIPEPDGDALKVWLIDREGRTVDHVPAWKAGDTRESGAGRISKVLEPLRQEWSQSATTPVAPLSLPDLQRGSLEGGEDAEKRTGWSRYAVAIGILLLVGAAASSDRGGSTRIEAAW